MKNNNSHSGEIFKFLLNKEMSFRERKITQEDPCISQVTFLKGKFCLMSLISQWKKVNGKVARSCPTLCHPVDNSPWNSPGQNTGVGSLSLLHWIFPTQESNRDLLHCRWILYQLSSQGSPKENFKEFNKSIPWRDFPGKNTEVGCYVLLQGIFPTLGSNLGLLHCRQTLYWLSHQEVL